MIAPHLQRPAENRYPESSSAELRRGREAVRPRAHDNGVSDHSHEMEDDQQRPELEHDEQRRPLEGFVEPTPQHNIKRNGGGADE